MTAKSLVLGLDGMDPSVVRTLGPKRLPTLFTIASRGAFAELESVRPYATLPNWATFLTGENPGVHGVFDFTTRERTRVRFTGGTVRAVPTIFARLDAAGARCACVGFPGTWPPERLARGVFVSGWDSPVAFAADETFVWPPSLRRDLVAALGAPREGDVDELRADAPGWLSALPDALVRRVERRTQLARWLLDRQDWDVLAFYFGESDTAAHYLWPLFDASSPRRPAQVSAADADGLARVYASLDAAVAELVEAAGGLDRVELTIVSDHGAGGSSDLVVHPNRALAAAGLCALREGEPLAQRAKRSLLPRVPPALRDALFHAGGRLLPGLVESAARFGGIDVRRSVAFSDELNYFPGVWISRRDEGGAVMASDIARARRDVTDALLALRDPFDGAPVFSAVHERESLYDGPHVSRAPDLVLDVAPNAQGYTPNILPSALAPRGAGPFRRLTTEEHLGKKGRGLPGAHRPLGVYFASGPRLAARPSRLAMRDATTSVLSRLDVQLADARGASRPKADVGDEARVVARLRALGYID